MQNPIPDKIMDVVTMSSDLAAGAAQYGASIPLLQHTEAYIRAKITPVVDAIMGLDAAEKELKARRSTVNGILDTAHGWLILGRDNFKPTLGSRYNQKWDDTGLRRSLVIRRTQVVITGLLRSYNLFLTNNPTMEVAEASKNITAARAQALLNQLDAARAAVGQQETQVQSLMADRNTKIADLRLCIRGTINELATRLTPLDARYASFKLNKPGALATPDVPEGLVAVLIGPNAVSVKWNVAARAEYYRVWKKVVGVDQELVPVGSPSDLDFTIQNLPANATIEIAVTAMNNGGESAKSAVVTIVTA